MRGTLKGVFGMLIVIALVALAGGYVYGQVPVPLQARIPNTTDYALMNLKMNLQCTQQETLVVTGTTVTATTKNNNYNEKDVIQVLSAHPECVTGGSFPTDTGKAKLYYQYSGSAFVVKVWDGTSTADISNTCMNLAPSSGDVLTGSENMITTTNTAKFTMLYEAGIHIYIPGSASADGLILNVYGLTKENLNLPKLNKGKQTLTDSWNSRSEGFGIKYTHTTAKAVYCTGTTHANGYYKRIP